MFTVALVGADGAGKTTISRALPAALPVPVKAIYMGVNLESGGPLLPSTRLLLALKRAHGKRPDLVAVPARPGPAPAGRSARAREGAKGVLRLAVWLSEELFRQGLAWYHSRLRKEIVVFDRHFFADYYAYDIAQNGESRPFGRRLHGFFLRHVYPQPDLVVCLDAPGELLHHRKSEASPEWLERRRREYLRLRGVVPNFVRVDASQPLAEVTKEVAAAIMSFHAQAASSRRRRTDAT